MRLNPTADSETLFHILNGQGVFVRLRLVPKCIDPIYDFHSGFLLARRFMLIRGLF